MLTAKKIEQAKYPCEPSKLFDGGGLYLLIAKTGKYWRYKYRLAGKENTFAIGVYPDVSLKQARDEHQRARDLVRKGIAPASDRKREKLGLSNAHQNNFRRVAEEWFNSHMKDMSESYKKRSMRILEKDLYPNIGTRPISEVSAPELLAVLRKIEGRGAPDMAHRAKQLSGQIMGYAIATGRTDRNIARELDGALAKRKKRHYAAITDPTLLGRLLNDIDNFSGTFVVKQALKLTIYLFPRPVELYAMPWSEINFDKKLWTINMIRMKSDRDHYVPLAPDVIAILEALYPITSKYGFVFGSARSREGHISENTVRQALRRMGYTNADATPHGFRATARTLLEEELDYPYHLTEHQQSRMVRDPMGRAYNRTTHLAKRIEMMHRWADYLGELKAR